MMKARDKFERLEARYWALNRNFEWTPENIEKLLALDAQIIACFEKLREEARQVLTAFQARMEGGDAFLHDFEIEASVWPGIWEEDETGELFEPDTDTIESMMLAEAMPGGIHLSFHVRTLAHLDDIIYLDKDLSWGDCPPLQEHFTGHRISYAIHELHDHLMLSFPDILRINHLWAELHVQHQHFEKVL